MIPNVKKDKYSYDLSGSVVLKLLCKIYIKRVVSKNYYLLLL